MADRYERIRIFEETMELCQNDADLQSAIRASRTGQKIIWEEDPLWDAGERRADYTHLVIRQGRTLAAAGKYIRPGRRVCVLNFASSVTPGGGVANGAGAQEESLCRISTLYAAISDRETAGAFYERHRQMIRSGEMGRKNRDDCIFTPGVLVIREDTFDCALLPKEEWYSVDVITCAAPDQRYDGPATYHPDETELTKVFERRWRRILSVAAQNKADILILGAFGCGAFCNPPEVAAQAFKKAYEKYDRCFDVVEFAVFSQDGDDSNYRAFSRMGFVRRVLPDRKYYINIDELFEEYIGRKLKPVCFCRAKRHGMDYVKVYGLMKMHFDDDGRISSFSGHGEYVTETVNGVTKEVFQEYDINLERLEDEIINYIES